VSNVKSLTHDAEAPARTSISKNVAQCLSTLSPSDAPRHRLFSTGAGMDGWRGGCRPGVRCQVSGVRCQVSGVRCRIQRHTMGIMRRWALGRRGWSTARLRNSGATITMHYSAWLCRPGGVAATITARARLAARSLRTPHSALRTPHSALRTPHSALPDHDGTVQDGPVEGVAVQIKAFYHDKTYDILGVHGRCSHC
jgi:hypothetical protein